MFALIISQESPVAWAEKDIALMTCEIPRERMATLTTTSISENALLLRGKLDATEHSLCGQR